jgi:hypothetical protein
MFFNEVVGKKNKHKNRKAIWFEYKKSQRKTGDTTPAPMHYYMQL